MESAEDRDIGSPGAAPADNVRTSEDDVARNKLGCNTEKTNTPSQSWGSVSQPAFRCGKNSTKEGQGEEDEECDFLGEPSHGCPITISQCIFQAHSGRVHTVAEARAFSSAMSAATKRKAASSGFVAPFSYRLSCSGGGGQQTPSNIGDSRVPENGDCKSEEGYCDNGDVGAGEKLLHLLQKWDVRHRVLMVTRIDRGFMGADLMGIRRYKFVIDRAKKLLEHTELLSLRRVADVDIYPLTTAETNIIPTVHEATLGGRHSLLPEKHPRAGTNSIGGGCGAVWVPLEDSWDRFVAPVSTRRRIFSHTSCGSIRGALRPSAAEMVSPPCTRSGGARGGRGRLRAENAKIARTMAEGSTRTRASRSLSLSHLSISSKTVEFPSGHVASVMGAKAHGKKQGRINHFAVRTPPSSPRRSLNSESSDGRYAVTSGWSLPPDLDPTSSVTSPKKSHEGTNRAAIRGGSNLGWASCSAYTIGASRASTCDTINSPSRVATILLGVAPGILNDHSLHPPPPVDILMRTGATAGRYHPRAIHRGLPYDGDASVSSGRLSPGVFSGIGTASPSGMGVSTAPSSSNRSLSYSQRRPPLPSSSASGESLVNGEAAPRTLPRRPSAGVSNDGGMGASGGESSSTSGKTTSWNESETFQAVNGYTLPSAGAGGGCEVIDQGDRGGSGGGSSNTSGATAGCHPPSLSQRPTESRVRDESFPSLVIVDGGDGAEAVAPLLSNESSIGRWQSDDDGSSSSMSTIGGSKPEAGPVYEDASAGEPPTEPNLP